MFHHIKGKLNPADVLSKHWAYADVRRLLRPLLFWHGDTALLKDDKSPSDKEGVDELVIDFS